MNEVLTYEALKSERDAQQKRADALAVENVALKDAIPRLKDIDYSNDSMDDVSLAEDIGFNEAVTQINNMVIKTPATDAALAAIRLEAKIEGANELAERIAEMHSKTAPGSNIEKKLMFAAEAAIAYANGLREAK